MNVVHALASTQADLVPLSVRQYHGMLAAGILDDGEPIELLDGFLVHKDRGEHMTVSPRHSHAVNRWMQLLARLEGCHLRLQQPVTIEPSHEPEPDAAIVAGDLERYRDRHPEASEILSVIEVSESSLERDRTVKQRIYAEASIPQYVIVNLVDRIVEVYESPDKDAGAYGEVRRLRSGETLSLRVARGSLDVAAGDLLP